MTDSHQETAQRPSVSTASRLTAFPCKRPAQWLGVCFLATAALATGAHASCADLPSHGALHAALSSAQSEANGGLEFHMWGALVDRDGTVCSIVFTGENRGDQWPGSRIIAVQKANTANAFSLPTFALSTANLFSAVQPGGSLFGLQASNPVDAQTAYGGDPELIGTEEDPLVGQRIGGVNVFGGGLALYDGDGLLLGALGVSGDTSCADHVISWRTREALDLDHVPAGVSVSGDDNIVFDIENGTSAGGYGHPECTSETTEIAIQLAVND